MKCIRFYVDCDNQPCLHPFGSFDRISFFNISWCDAVRGKSTILGKGGDGNEMKCHRNKTKNEQSAPVENSADKIKTKTPAAMIIIMNKTQCTGTLASIWMRWRRYEFFVVYSFSDKMLVSAPSLQWANFVQSRTHSFTFPLLARWHLVSSLKPQPCIHYLKNRQFVLCSDHLWNICLSPNVTRCIKNGFHGEKEQTSEAMNRKWEILKKWEKKTSSTCLIVLIRIGANLR